MVSCSHTSTARRHPPNDGRGNNPTMHFEGLWCCARVGYQGPMTLGWALCSRFGSGYLIDNMSIAGWKLQSPFTLFANAL